MPACSAPAEDRPIALRDAPDVIAERVGFPVSYMSLWRAVREGSAAADGSRVFLDSFRCGHRLFVSVATFRKYIADLAAADRRARDAQQDDMPSPTPTKPRRRRERVQLSNEAAQAAAAGL